MKRRRNLKRKFMKKRYRDQGEWMKRKKGCEKKANEEKRGKHEMKLQLKDEEKKEQIERK